MTMVEGQIKDCQSRLKSARAKIRKLNKQVLKEKDDMELRKVVDNPDIVYRIYSKEKADEILNTFRGVIELNKELGYREDIGGKG